ncbi:MAG TPA: SIS domain-containing protein [Bryobacteraceae bacterium]
MEVEHYTIDPDMSRFTVRAFASGMLSSFGHNPTLAVRDFTGRAEFTPDALDAAALHIKINAGSLNVTDSVSEKDRREIERTMNQEVLETEAAGERRAMTFALPGLRGSYACNAASQDPFVHQEIVEILYHTLWETVHVFFEHRELGHDVGAAGFLYPFLGQEKQQTGGVLAEVAASIRMKVAEDAKLREQTAQEQAGQIAAAASAIRDRLARGGKLILFGNGGSATDANDWALDCVHPPAGYQPVPAVSLSLEPANISALANDVGTEVIFLRQLIAHARPEDVAVGISTSGGSKNIIMALEEARKRNLLTVALLGYDGGEIVRRGIVDWPVVVRSDYIPRIQEVQASIYHIIRELLEITRHAQD